MSMRGTRTERSARERAPSWINTTSNPRRSPSTIAVRGASGSRSARSVVRCARQRGDAPPRWWRGLWPDRPPPRAGEQPRHLVPVLRRRPWCAPPASSAPRCWPPRGRRRPSTSTTGRSIDLSYCAQRPGRAVASIRVPARELQRLHAGRPGGYDAGERTRTGRLARSAPVLADVHRLPDARHKGQGVRITGLRIRGPDPSIENDDPIHCDGDIAAIRA